MNGFLDTVLYPLEWFVAMDHVRLPHRAASPRAAGGLRVDLGPVDRRAGGRHADPADPAVRQADPRLPPDAADPAGDAEDPEEVQGQVRPRVPSGHDAGDDGAVQAHGDQPVQLVPADPAAVAVLLRPVPGAQQLTASPTAPAADRPDHASRSRRRRSSSTIFGAQLSSIVHGRPTDVTVKIVTVVLIVLMSATTFTTQRQLMMKNMPASALDNPFAKQQKMLLYLMPLVLRDLRHQLPDRCPALLADHQPVVDGPAVLRHPPHAGPGLRWPRRRSTERRMKSARAKTCTSCPGRSHEEPAEDVQDTVDEPAKPVGPAPAAQAQEAQPSGTPNGTKPATKPAAKPGAPASASTATGGDTTAASRDA